jgi:hypothetical protein
MKNVFILFLLIWIILFSNNLKSQDNYITVTYRNFNIVYSALDEKRAVNVIKILEFHLPKMEENYQMELTGRITIYLPENLHQLKKLSETNIPTWSIAAYFPMQNILIIKKPEWTDTVYQLEQNLVHELSHVFFYQKFGDLVIPLWFNEGLAEYFSKGTIDLRSSVSLSNAILSRRIISLVDIDSLIYFPTSKARLAYIESLSSILFLHKYLIQNDMNWSDFFYTIENWGFEEALKKVTHWDIIDYEINWYHWVKKKYRWLFLLNLENIIWLLFILVTIGALFAIRYRNKKILSEWEAEEKDSLEVSGLEFYTNRDMESNVPDD